MCHHQKELDLGISQLFATVTKSLGLLTYKEKRLILAHGSGGTGLGLHLLLAFGGQNPRVEQGKGHGMSMHLCISMETTKFLPPGFGHVIPSVFSSSTWIPSMFVFSLKVQIQSMKNTSQIEISPFSSSYIGQHLVPQTH